MKNNNKLNTNVIMKYIFNAKEKSIIFLAF